MMINGIPMQKINAMAQPHGLIPIFVEGADESVDDEIQLREADGTETGIAIQLSGRFCTATEWSETDETVWFGIERTSIEACMADALARFTSRQ